MGICQVLILILKSETVPAKAQRGSAGADRHTVTREVAHHSLHAVVGTWGWYSSGGSVDQLQEAKLTVLIWILQPGSTWGWVLMISAPAEAWAKLPSCVSHHRGKSQVPTGCSYLPQEHTPVGICVHIPLAGNNLVQFFVSAVVYLSGS